MRFVPDDHPFSNKTRLRARLIATGVVSAFVTSVFLTCSGAVAQNIRGSATGPTSAPGYDHPGQYMHLQDVKPADH